MPKQLPPLSDAQLAVMNVVWDLRSCTVADVLRELRKEREIARNTVQTTLSRLDEKGWLKHREEDGKFFYSAAVPRQRAQRQYMQRIVEKVFDGSAEGLMLALLQTRPLSSEEAQRIRKLIREAEERS